MVDEWALRKIISAADLTSDDTVVEVGPGLGILTEKLTEQAGRVVAVEIDTNLASVLKERFSKLRNLTILNADVLHLATTQILPKKYHLRYKVVANLPYYIASAVIRHFLEDEIKPSCIVVTVQKEVAQRIVAPVGKMSLLSVSVQFYGKPTIVSYLPPQCFYPPPKVDSAIVKIDVFEHPAIELENIRDFFRIVEAGFNAPRKQLHNSLALGLSLSPQVVSELLKEAGINSSCRPKDLTFEEWGKICKIFVEKGC